MVFSSAKWSKDRIYWRMTATLKEWGSNLLAPSWGHGFESHPQPSWGRLVLSGSNQGPLKFTASLFDVQHWKETMWSLDRVWRAGGSLPRKPPTGSAPGIPDQHSMWRSLMWRHHLLPCSCCRIRAANSRGSDGTKFCRWETGRGARCSSRLRPSTPKPCCVWVAPRCKSQWISPKKWRLFASFEPGISEITERRCLLLMRSSSAICLNANATGQAHSQMMGRKIGRSKKPETRVTIEPGIKKT